MVTPLPRPGPWDAGGGDTGCCPTGNEVAGTGARAATGVGGDCAACGWEGRGRGRGPAGVRASSSRAGDTGGGTGTGAG